LDITNGAVCGSIYQCRAPAGWKQVLKKHLLSAYTTTGEVNREQRSTTYMVFSLCNILMHSFRHHHMSRSFVTNIPHNSQISAEHPSGAVKFVSVDEYLLPMASCVLSLFLTFFA
jgi:hypothetical protein